MGELAFRCCAECAVWGTSWEWIGDGMGVEWVVGIL